MKTMIPLRFVGAIVIATSASAQPFGYVPPQKAGFIQECEARWAAADRNGDGWLDMDEIEAAAALIPKTIQSPASISQRQFMDACIKVAQGASD